MVPHPLQELNGKYVFASEFNFHAQRTYEINFGEIPFGLQCLPDMKCAILSLFFWKM